MVKKFFLFLVVLISCFCMFGFTDSDNVEFHSDSLVDLTNSRWVSKFIYDLDDPRFENDWTAYGKFNVIIDLEDGRSLVPDSEGYSLKVGYNLDVADGKYISYHFNDVGWVSYKLLEFNTTCFVVGGSDVTNPYFIDFFEIWYLPYESFYGLYIMTYDYVEYESHGAYGSVKVSDNLNLSDLRSVNLNVEYDSELSSVTRVSFGSYSFLHDVYVNGQFTDYVNDYNLLVLDEDSNYNYRFLKFLWNNSGNILPSYDPIYRPSRCELNGSIPLSGSYAINYLDFVNFVSSSGSRGGTLSMLIESEGRYYRAFQISYDSIYGKYDLSLIAPSGASYSDLDLGSIYIDGSHIAPIGRYFTFGTSTLTGCSQDFYDWFISTTYPVSLEPVDSATTLSGVWQANSSLTYLDFTENVKFLVNGVWYNQMLIEPGFGPPDHYVLEFQSLDFNGNFEYDIRAAYWNDDFTFAEFSEWRSGIIDFGKYDQFVSSDFYDWFTSNFTYVGESSEVPPSDEELLGFFPRLFSTVQQALDSFVFYTTESGYNLTLWTFIVVILGISFIVWILKLIAGG